MIINLKQKYLDNLKFTYVCDQEVTIMDIENEYLYVYNIEGRLFKIKNDINYKFEKINYDNLSESGKNNLLHFINNFKEDKFKLLEGEL